MTESSPVSGKAVFFLVMAVAIGGFFLYTTVFDGSDEMPDRKVAVVPVSVVAAASHVFQEEIHAVGTLTAKSRALVSPRVAGNVEETTVDLGVVVEKGQELVKIDSTNYRLALKNAEAAQYAASAAIAQAKVQLSRAKKEHKRAQDLLKTKVVSQSGYDAAEAAYLAAKEAVNLTQQQHKQAQVGVEIAQKHLDDTVIRAPISGVVVMRNVEVGQSVAPGVPLITIVEQAELRVEIDVPEVNFSDVATLTQVEISIDALSDKIVHGEIDTINPLVDRRTRTFKVRIDVDNADGQLVDGMFTRVRLLTSKREALSLPRDALLKLPGSGSYYVFVANNGVATKTNITVGVTDDAYAEIRAGVENGDRVVISGASRLRSGTPVSLLKSAAN